MPIEPIHRFKLSSEVAAQIQRMISAGEYGPGDRLPSERHLCDQFAVGRSSTREALRLLEANGVVEIIHGVGTFVAEPRAAPSELPSLLVLGETTVPELFEFRRAIEGEAAALAAKRGGGSEVEELHELVARMRDPELSQDAYVELDAALHGTIARATRNPYFTRYFEAMQDAFRTYSHRVIGLPGRRERATAGHSDIVEHIAAKRARAARTAMLAHLQAAEEDILRQLR